LTLESIYNIEGGDGLSLGVLSVGDGVADDTLEEDFEDTSGFFVDEAGDTLDTATTRETTDSGLRDTLCFVSGQLKRIKEGTYGCCLGGSCDDA
jgi:RNA polymerase-binding transcription factor DksA